VFGIVNSAEAGWGSAVTVGSLAAGLGFFPMTVVNFAVAIAVPRLTRRFGNSVLLASGLAVTLASTALTGSAVLLAVALVIALATITAARTPHPIPPRIATERGHHEHLDSRRASADR
jgi:hypothetical protein